MSYNLIRNSSAIIAGGKKIETKVPVVKEEKIEEVNEALIREEDLKRSYEIIGANIISKAKQEAQELIIKATNSISEMEKEAYEKGYGQGVNNGYEDGYNEGYEAAINKAKEECSKIIEDANVVLCRANNEYEEYMELKKENIIKLTLEMAKVIARKEFQKEASILNLIEPMIEDCKGEENIVIRSNSMYIQAIRDRVEYWKNAYTLKGEIFVLEDTLMEIGNAVIQKNTGKIVVGMDIALKELEEVVKEQIFGGKYD